MSWITCFCSTDLSGAIFQRLTMSPVQKTQTISDLPSDVRRPEWGTRLWKTLSWVLGREDLQFRHGLLHFHLVIGRQSQRVGVIEKGHLTIRLLSNAQVHRPHQQGTENQTAQQSKPADPGERHDRHESINDLRRMGPARGCAGMNCFPDQARSEWHPYIRSLFTTHDRRHTR